MSLQKSVFVALVLLGLDVALTRTRVQAAKPVSPTAAVTFEKTLAPSFNSDMFYGNGTPVPYVDGVDNISAGVFGSTHNLSLNLQNSSRRFFGTVSCDISSPLCFAPSNTFNDGLYMNIQRISDMVEGETRQTHAIFIAAFGIQQRPNGFNTQYSFGWCSPYTTILNYCAQGQWNGSQLVSVYRVPGTPSPTWTVNNVTPDPPNGVGPVSELHRSVKSPYSDSFLGLYKASFQLTIVCQTNCGALPQ